MIVAKPLPQCDEDSPSDDNLRKNFKLVRPMPVCAGVWHDVHNSLYISLWYYFVYNAKLIQWNRSIKDPLNTVHLSNGDTVCSPNHTELCTNLPLN